MKLIILHLSDMHFTQHENFSNDNINAIVSTLQEFAKNSEHLLIIVSGDLAYSGKENEMKNVKKFFDVLITAIHKKYKIKDIRFAIVPGNHDIDFNKGNLNRTGLEKINTDNMYESNLPTELLKQSQFYSLAKHYDCYPDRELLHKKIFTYGDKHLLVNLINTAPFSAKIDEDQGFHYLPEKDITALMNQGDNDFVITVMHHPHHWFVWNCRKKLETVIYSRSDLIYVGHEHYETSMKIENLDTSVNVFSGGKLCNCGDWTGSEFNLSILDLETREYETRRYWLDAEARIYQGDDCRIIYLSKNRYNQLGLLVRDEFKNDLHQDRYAISKSNQDYFVFPLLEEEYIIEDKGRLPREINSIDDFMKILFENGKIIINGRNDTGKSILAGAIFEELSKKKIALFIKGKDVTKNFERTIRNVFEDEYSKERAAFESLKQTSPDELAIIIDDVDDIDESIRFKFIEYIEEQFGIIVETCQSDMDVDIKKRLKQRARTKEYIVFQIAPFYSNKRKELVTNIVYQITKDENDNLDKTIEILCDALTKQKYLYGFNPDFIVQFVKYYCSHIGETMKSDGSVFGKVFEANITNLISPHAKKITVEKIFIILDKIAYFIYMNRTYPITLTKIALIIEEYNNDYGSRISPGGFIKILLSARIFKEVEGNYLFANRNYLAYFIAREIRRKVVEEHDDSQFIRVMTNSHMPINADILLFVTYITENKNIIQNIMQQALISVSNWTEFELNNTDISFLIKPAELVIKPVMEEDIKNEDMHKVEQEKMEVKSVSIVNDARIFSGESDELDFLEKIVRSISLMMTVARILPSFEHLMKKTDKDSCIQLIYQMPLKIFEAWAREVDGITSELVRDIKNYHEWEYRKDKPNYTPLDDDKALYILKWEATSMLLEIMNTSITYATRENTEDFIDSFSFKTKPTYRIEHLMSLGRRENIKDFIKESIELIDEKDSLTKVLVRRVARNLIVNSSRIKSSERQKLNEMVLNQKGPQSRMLIERNRNMQKQ